MVCEMSEDRPIIKIFERDKSQYEVYVDNLKISVKDAYLLMRGLVEIYEGNNL